MDIQIPQLDEFSLQVTVYIKPEDVPRFFEAFQTPFEQVCAMPECVYFEVFQDPTDLGKLSWVENWKVSPKWFMENQMTKEYYKPYLAITEPMFIKPREFKILKRLGLPYVLSKPGNVA